MEIIKAGNEKFKRGPIVFTCPLCGCVFEANPDEYQTIALYQDDTPVYLYKYTDCPTCGNSVSKEESTK